MENLRRKPTYNELINYLEFEQPKIKYPNRNATFLRNSPYLSQFDGGSWIDLEKQENDINKEKMKEVEVRRIATGQGTTAQAVRANLTQRQAPKLNVSMLFDSGYDSGVESYMDDMEDEEQRTLDENVRRLNAMKAMGSRAVSEASDQEQRHFPSFYFLSTPDRPSAPPESVYNTPVAPRNLDEEFKSPEDSARKIQAAFRKKKAEAEAKHQQTREEKFVFEQPSSSSSSSSKIPTGPKPIKARPIQVPDVSPERQKQTRARSVDVVEKQLSQKIEDAKINYYRNKTELMNLSKVDLLIQVEFRKQALKTRGVEFDSTSSVSALRRIVEENKDLFLTATSSPEKMLERGADMLKSIKKKLTKSK
jgi:hypothetical protein